MKKINNINDNQLALIASNTNLTLTPNNRTASVLTNHVVTQLLHQTNKTACITPKIKALSVWIEETFDSLRSNNVEPFSSLAIISENEVISYWLKAMHFDPINQSLVNTSEWLSDALSADKVLSRWQIGKYTADSHLSERFKVWRSKVQREILSKGFVTLNMSIELIISAIRLGQVSIPKNVSLYAFDEQPPLYKSLFMAIGEKATLQELNPMREKSQWFNVPTADSKDQLDTVAKWASNVIETEPDKTIAIVSPDLRVNKKAIINSLNNVFEPQWILPESGIYSAPYDISLGQTLKQIPLFKRALYYLSINGENVKSEDVINIITDPFTNHSKQESLERRKFASKMRDNRGFKTSLLGLAMKRNCPQRLSKSLNDFVHFNSMHPEKMMPSRWAVLFHKSLNAIGWSVGITMNELELLGSEKWKETLDTLSCLDIHTGVITREIALKILDQYCANALVTPTSKNSPVSVLGTLEAAGLDFDYIYVLDCNDNVFPAPASLNTFIPSALQITEKMPHSSGEREFEFTMQLFSRYRNSCSKLYTSYVKSDHQGCNKKPASVLSGASAEVQKNSIVDSDIIDYKKITFRQFSVSEKNDDIGSLVVHENKVPGGVAVLDQMNLCGMQAVTSKRLKVGNHNPNYTMGLTGAERGEMLHGALESFWSEVIEKNKLSKLGSHSDELKLLSYEECLSLIEKSVDMAFFWLDREDIDIQLVAQEKIQMTNTISQWIELEKKRDNFNIIAMESTSYIDLGGYQLKIRKDRLDEVLNSENNNKKLALDYKSSEELVSSAFSSTPKAQLPLAALSDCADGIGYLNVKPNMPNISGVVNGAQSSDLQLMSEHRYKATRDWGELKDQWIKGFSEQIKKYVSGEVSYTPSAKSCSYCVKRSLCEHAIR